jgi:hypothetical protein
MQHMVAMILSGSLPTSSERLRSVAFAFSEYLAALGDFPAALDAPRSGDSPWLRLREWITQRSTATCASRRRSYWPRQCPCAVSVDMQDLVVHQHVQGDDISSMLTARASEISRGTASPSGCKMATAFATDQAGGGSD